MWNSRWTTVTPSLRDRLRTSGQLASLTPNRVRVILCWQGRKVGSPWWFRARLKSSVGFQYSCVLIPGGTGHRSSWQYRRIRTSSRDQGREGTDDMGVLVWCLARSQERNIHRMRTIVTAVPQWRLGPGPDALAGPWAFRRFRHCRCHCSTHFRCRVPPVARPKVLYEYLLL